MWFVNSLSLSQSCRFVVVHVNASSVFLSMFFLFFLGCRRCCSPQCLIICDVFLSWFYVVAKAFELSVGIDGSVLCLVENSRGVS
jgi:hypothetical protein